MNFHQLRVFYEVARAQSFSAAAEKLHLSQPAITWQIKNLEQYYEIQFFERMGRKIFLTEEGKILFEFVDRILSFIRETEEALADLRGLSRGVLRIDSVFTFADYYLANILQAFHRRYPRLILQIKTGNTNQIIENTLEHKNDLAFVAYDPQNEKLKVQEVISDALVAVVAPHHPWAKKKSINLKDLQNQPLILREYGSSPRRVLEEVLQKRGIFPRVIMESASTMAIKKMVEEGLGVAILSQQVIKEECRSQRLIKLSLRDAEIVYRFYLIYHKDKYLSRSIQAFIQLAMELFRKT